MKALPLASLALATLAAVGCLRATGDANEAIGSSRAAAFTADGGTDGGPVACHANADCPGVAGPFPTQFCKKDTCDVAAIGACTPMPAIFPEPPCDRTIDWVCGCDDTTYSNGCAANAAGVNVGSRGQCRYPANPCAADGDCLVGKTFCQKDHCDAAAGTCAPVPPLESCPAPTGADRVCGCDHATYASACDAALVAVNVDHRGDCPPLPVGRACASQDDCGGAGYAHLVECLPAACGNPRGACAAVPAGCTFIKAPVCGCNGVTYENACWALFDDVAIASQGACAPRTGGS
jgi:hypothetical protein